jgi:DNA-binding beta-propeller fold protein YncE
MNPRRFDRPLFGRSLPVFCSGVLTATLIACCLGASARAGDQPSLELIQTIDLRGKSGGLDHVALDAGRQRLFVANKVNNTMDIVDLKAGKLLQQIPGQQGIQGISYAPDLDRIYVGLGGQGLFNIFNAKTYRPLKTIKFADDSDNVRYDPRTHLVYVAHAETSLGVVDGKALALKTDIKLPGEAEGFQIEKDRPRMYVCIPSPCKIAVIDTDKNEIAGAYPINLAGGATAVALDEPNHRVFVACRKEPLLVVLDSESGKEITSAPIAGDVDDMFFDAQRKKLYASCGEGYLVVIKQKDADTYEAVEKIPTAKGAKTSLFVPETGRLYLAVPRQEGKPGPEIRIYQAKP